MRASPGNNNDGIQKRADRDDKPLHTQDRLANKKGAPFLSRTVRPDYGNADDSIMGSKRLPACDYVPIW
jgi:hypothetical protein